MVGPAATDSLGAMPLARDRSDGGTDNASRLARMTWGGLIGLGLRGQKGRYMAARRENTAKP